MSTASAAEASSRAVGAATIAEAFRITAEDHPDRVAVRTKDDEVSLTWGELRDRVDALARGLHELGVRRGDTVALMLLNRPEFAIADLAVMTRARAWRSWRRCSSARCRPPSCLRSRRSSCSRALPETARSPGPTWRR